MGLTDYLAFFVVGIAWCQRHQDRVAALSAHVINVFPHIAAIGVYRFLFSSLFNRYVQRIVAYTRNAGTGTSRVVWPVVVVADRDDDPVTRADSLADGFPQLVIECAAAHTAQSLVLDGNLGGVEIFVGIVAPAPLTIVAITQCTCAHGGIAN